MKNYIRNLFAAALLLTLPLAVSAAPADTSGQDLPDILGFRLGMTVPEVMALAASINLPEQPYVNEGRMSIAGLPGSEFRPQLKFLGPQGAFKFEFNAPPRESRVISAHRSVNYEKYAPDEAPSVSAVKAALVEKFGTPTAVFVPTANHERLTWLWATDGRLQTKELGMECRHRQSSYDFARARGGAPPNPRIEKMMDDGCAVVLEVILVATPAGVTKRMGQTTYDFAGAYRADVATHQAVKDSVQKQNEKDLQEASSESRRSDCAMRLTPVLSAVRQDESGVARQDRVGRVTRYCAR